MLLPKGSKTLNAPGPTPHRGEFLSRRPSPLLLQSHTIPKHRRKLSSNSPRTYHLPKKKNIRESFATYRPDRRFSAVQNAIGRRRDIYRDLSYHGRRPPPTAHDNSDRYCGGGLWNNCSWDRRDRVIRSREKKSRLSLRTSPNTLPSTDATGSHTQLLKLP